LPPGSHNRSTTSDQVGLDVFGIDEHHRAEFLDSASAMILAAAAARTQNFRLASAVTVLSAAATKMQQKHRSVIQWKTGCQEPE
jgi:alkanesulfonate monooxygenase SsuD/methylene tetrahydromethanopterin reductase-like flavin-dependent oxidoreductase (luciferase family)